MYAFEAFLSIVVALAYVNGVLRGRRRWTVAARAVARADGVRAQLGALPLRRARAGDGALRARAAAGVRARRGGVAHPLPAVGADAALAGEAHRRALVDHAELPRARSRARRGARRRCAVHRVRARRRRRLLALVAAGATTRAHGRARACAVVGVTVLLAWLSSQISPAWTTRYFAVVLGPVVLLAARGLVARGRRVGLVALVAMLFLWCGLLRSGTTRRTRSRSRRGVAPFVHPGELVISTHPEQVPVLRYYLGAGLRWATTLGPVPDSQVFDWRDAVARLRGGAAASDRSIRCSRRCPRGASSSSSRPSSATTARGTRDLDAPRLADGRSAWYVAAPARPARPPRSGTSRPTRSRSSGTTSSRCRRSSIAESARFGGRGRRGRGRPHDDETPPRRRSSSAAARPA